MAGLPHSASKVISHDPFSASDGGSSSDDEEHYTFSKEVPMVFPGKVKGRKRRTSSSSQKKPVKTKSKKIKESVLDPTQATTREEWEKMVFQHIPQTGQGESDGSQKLISALNPGEIFIKKHLPLLLMLTNDSSLRSSNKMQRQTLIDTMSKEQMKAITKLMRDFLDVKYPIPPDVVDKLKEDKDLIYQLSSEQVSDDDKKNILRQKGGFLPLAALAATPILSMLGKVALEPLIQGTVGAIFHKALSKKK